MLLRIWVLATEQHWYSGYISVRIKKVTYLSNITDLTDKRWGKRREKQNFPSLEHFCQAYPVDVPGCYSKICYCASCFCGGFILMLLFFFIFVFFPLRRLCFLSSVGLTIAFRFGWTLRSLCSEFALGKKQNKKTKSLKHSVRVTGFIERVRSLKWDFNLIIYKNVQAQKGFGWLSNCWTIGTGRPALCYLGLQTLHTQICVLLFLDWGSVSLWMEEAFGENVMFIIIFSTCWFIKNDVWPHFFSIKTYVQIQNEIIVLDLDWWIPSEMSGEIKINQSTVNTFAP